MSANMQSGEFLQFLKDYVNKSEGEKSPWSTPPLDARRQTTWTQYQKMRADGRLPNVRVKENRLKETSLTVTETNNLYGCGGLFGLCGPDDIIGLTMQDDPLVQWLGFYPDVACEKFIKGWTYTDVAGTAAGQIETHVYGAACDDPPTSEKSICEFYQGDFGTLRGCGEAVNVANLGIRKCDKQPTYTLPIEGIGPVRIDNDLDLETIAAAQLEKHEVSREMILGDKNTAYQMDGLVNMVKTGYVSIQGNRCTSMDSVVVDWSNDDMTGAVNGHGSIVAKVRDMWRRIAWRIRQSGLGMPAEGDVALVMPSWMAWQLIDEWAWWSVRTGGQYNEVFRDVYAMREFRDKYSVGLFGGGYVTIDGFNIHIISHDWMTIEQNAPNFCADIYLLVRAIGGRRVLQGQYLPADIGADSVANVAGYRYFNVEPFQGGRALRWVKFDNACAEPCVLFRPRLYLETPWAEGKIENVCVSVQFNPMSLDPQSNYFIEANKVAATQANQYFYDVDLGTWFHTASNSR